MNFFEGNIYHVYNRGNDRRPIFFERRNYLYFLEKTRKYICPGCDLLAWVLMPNHFHFLIYANSLTTKMVRRHPVIIDRLTEGIRVLLSSYTKAIQKQEGTTGSLFQQKTKSKCVNDRDANYSLAAFKYIHQNPCRAGLVKNINDWEFSSFHEYFDQPRSNVLPLLPPLCNTSLARRILNFNSIDIGVDEEISVGSHYKVAHKIYHKGLESKS